MIFVTIDFLIVYYIVYYIVLQKFYFFLGPPSVPIIGHSLIGLNLSPEAALKKALEFYTTYGNVIGAYIGTKTVVFLADPQDVEIILSSSVHIDKAEDYQ